MTAVALALIAALSVQTTTRADDARSVAELVVIGPSCDVAGYDPEPGTIAAEREAFVARWVAMGFTADDATGALDDAIRTQTARMDALKIERSDHNTSEQNRQEGMMFRDFVLSACLRSSQTFPLAVAPTENSGRMFFGWMGLWLDYPLLEEAAFYLSARGLCAAFTEPYDARAAADAILAAFPSQPEPVRADVRKELVANYTRGQTSHRRLDRTQCGRLMPTAERAFRAAWAAHDGASGMAIPI